jgi:hypothetical protein
MRDNFTQKNSLIFPSFLFPTLHYNQSHFHHPLNRNHNFHLTTKLLIAERLKHPSTLFFFPPQLTTILATTTASLSTNNHNRNSTTYKSILLAAIVTSFSKNNHDNNFNHLQFHITSRSLSWPLFLLNKQILASFQQIRVFFFCSKLRENKS